ncbi:hypothetical protein ACFQV2_20130 [Actinokineospora soli]|uniref:XRE family transcriptional regulator n=1 Tax=Actinokineospora soli TaxID=1048753 RepID=A0ABW2TR25_9PSEU
MSVSLATLSYWQTGRSRPERRASMVAVEVLEQVLRLDAGALSGLLEPPRRTRKAVPRPAIGALWPQSAEVEDVVGAVDTAWDARLSRISQHDVVVVGTDQGERSFTTRQVLRAEEDGPDRWVVVVHLDEHDRALPLVRPVRNCVLGRVVTRPSAGLLVAELLFPRPLRRGRP